MDKMNGRERVLAAMALKTVDRTPWVPFVGCHGGSLIGMKSGEYLRSASAMEKGAAEAVRRYSPDGLPVVFDLQIEAEALGCELAWADENPPAVVSHPLAESGRVEALSVPSESAGRIRTVMDAAGRLRKAHPDLALYGLITGPFTLAMHLFGTDLFIKMIEDEPFVRKLLAFSRDVGFTMSDLYMDAGCDVIAVVDPMTSQISPGMFRAFVTEPATALFGHVRSRKKAGSFFVCGHAQQNLEAMCECRPDNVSVDENIPLEFVRDTCLSRGISFGGNLQLTLVLLLGTVEDCRRHALECLETGGGRGFILSPGCDLPYGTPPENLEAVARLVLDPYERDVVRAMKTRPALQSLLDMSEYGQADKVIVDIITLDSEACAPCQYMVEAVRRIAPQFEGIVEWREHKIKHAESIQFMTSLMVKNIPTICIDGKITFVSQIPPKETLVAAIQERIYEKLQTKIRMSRGEILILGRSREECEPLKLEVTKAVRELGVDIRVTVATDEARLRSYGILRTPAVVSVQAKVKSEGHVPHVAAIKEWIKEMR